MSSLHCMQHISACKCSVEWTFFLVVQKITYFNSGPGFYFGIFKSFIMLIMVGAWINIYLEACFSMYLLNAITNCMCVDIEYLCHYLLLFSGPQFVFMSNPATKTAGSANQLLKKIWGDFFKYCFLLCRQRLTVTCLCAISSVSTSSNLYNFAGGETVLLV